MLINLGPPRNRYPEGIWGQETCWGDREQEEAGKVFRPRCQADICERRGQRREHSLGRVSDNSAVEKVLSSTTVHSQAKINHRGALHWAEMARPCHSIMLWHQLEAAHGEHGLDVNAADPKSVADGNYELSILFITDSSSKSKSGSSLCCLSCSSISQNVICRQNTNSLSLAIYLNFHTSIFEATKMNNYKKAMYTDADPFSSCLDFAHKKYCCFPM